MFAVHIKKLDGTVHTYNDVNNISVTSGRVLIVKGHNEMKAYRPGDLSEVKFTWNGNYNVMREEGD